MGDPDQYRSEYSSESVAADKTALPEKARDQRDEDADLIAAIVGGALAAYGLWTKYKRPKQTNASAGNAIVRTPKRFDL